MRVKSEISSNLYKESIKALGNMQSYVNVFDFPKKCSGSHGEVFTVLQAQKNMGHRGICLMKLIVVHIKKCMRLLRNTYLLFIG